MRLLITLLASLIVAYVANAQSIFDVINTRSDLTTLATVLKSPGYESLKTSLSSTTANYTLFAPNDDAFKSATFVNATSISDTSALLLYHVLSGTFYSTAIPSGLTPVATLLSDNRYVNYGANQPARVIVTKSESGVSVNFRLPGRDYEAIVVEADVPAGSSVIHIVDEVFQLPTTISATAAAAGLTSLLSALQSRNLISTVDNTAGITVFAPDNDAFNNAQLLGNLSSVDDVLKTHVVSGIFFSTDVLNNLNKPISTLSGTSVTIRQSGSNLSVNNVKLGSTLNVITKNGIVHLMFGVIGQPDKRNTIVQNAAVVGALSTLYTVLSNSNYKSVLDALSGLSQGTVFAPTNAAFTALNPNISKVADITATLQYHVLGSTVLSSSITKGFVPTILTSGSAYVNRGSGAAALVYVEKLTTGVVSLNFGIPGSSAYTATVAFADVICTNGVVHVIDKVLLPPSAPSALATAANLNKLASALNTAKLLSTVDSSPNITIFAPLDAGFDAAQLVSNSLADVLLFHVFPGTLSANDLISLNGRKIFSLNGKAFTVEATSTYVKIGNSRVQLANVLSRSGFIHVIDRVIGTPSKLNTLVENALLVPQLSTLVSVLTDNRYRPVLETLLTAKASTVFAPTNAAFTAAGVNISNVALVTAVLQYHVLASTVPSSDLSSLQFPSTLLTSSQYVNLGGQGQVLGISKSESNVNINFGLPNQNAKVVNPDIAGSNGVIHVIDSLLVPPTSTSATATAAGLTKLAEALTSTNLLSTIDSTAKLTIFAPNNAAFEAAQASGADLSAISSILKYHVISGKLVYSNTIQGSSEETTLEGTKVKVTVGTDGAVKVNDAKVVIANVLTKNAVVHVIDTVLDPNSDESGASLLHPTLSVLSFTVAFFFSRFL